MMEGEDDTGAPSFDQQHAQCKREGSLFRSFTDMRLWRKEIGCRLSDFKSIYIFLTCLVFFFTVTKHTDPIYGEIDDVFTLHRDTILKSNAWSNIGWTSQRSMWFLDGVPLPFY
jgi:hypothetical protein